MVNSELINKDTLYTYLQSDFLYNQLPGGFISYLPNGRILRVNETFSKWMASSTEEICELNLRSILNEASVIYYNTVIDPLLDLEFLAEEISLTFKSPSGEVSYTNIHKQKMLQIANYSSLSLSLTSAHKTLVNILGLIQLLEYEELTEESGDLFKMPQTSVQELDEIIKLLPTR